MAVDPLTVTYLNVDRQGASLAVNTLLEICNT